MKTLYENFPHQEVIRILHKLVQFSLIFFWTKRNRRFKKQIRIMVNQLCYFAIGNLVPFQCTYIPDMRLILFPVQLESINLEPSILSFIDGECNLNDSVQPSKFFHEIYLNDLQLKFEHHGLHTTFFDLDITVFDGIYKYKLYVKRDNYPFFIARVPHLKGNVPAYNFYGSILSEFLRIAKWILKLYDFVPLTKKLFLSMMNRGANQVTLLKHMKK